MMKRRSLIVLLGAFVGALAVCTSISVQAQNALGGGNSLDRNLGVGTGGINPATPTSNFRDRNLLITGDVIGGRGFRGSVGYTAESDFRGALGSNDLFSFRADSAISSAPLFQMGSTYERLRFGQDIGMVEYRRAGSAAPESINAQNPVGVSEMGSRFQLDRRILSATTALSPQQGSEPRIVGAVRNEEGTLFVFTASTLRGLTAEPAANNASIIGFNSYDMARIRKDVTDGQPPSMLGSPFQTPLNTLFEEQPAEKPAAGAIDIAQEPNVAAKRIESTVPEDYQHVLKRVAERYAHAENVDLAASPDLLNQLGKEFDQLRERLTGQRANANDQPSTRAAPDGPTTQSPSTDTAPVPDGESVRPDPLMPLPPPGRDPQTGLPIEPTTTTPSSIEFAAALRHDQRINTLTGVSKDRFNELMSVAEQRLRAGDYLTAEQRFERALRFSPGHPLATAGMAHAQLGAGLYLSASLTLRSLFLTQPEMIDTTFGEGLLPAKDRIAAAIGGITRRMEMSDSKDRVAYGFLLAYLGHQTDDSAMIELGLNAMADAEPDHPLLETVRAIWQPAPSEQTDPPAPQK